MGKKITVELYWNDEHPLNRVTLAEKLEEVLYRPDISLFDNLEAGDTGDSFWSHDGSRYEWTITETND